MASTSCAAVRPAAARQATPRCTPPAAPALPRRAAPSRAAAPPAARGVSAAAASHLRRSLGQAARAPPARGPAPPAAEGAAIVPPSKGEGEFLGIGKATWLKIVPLGFMFFCILFNYTILRDTKDVLVVTAPGSGAEVIPFLKTWVNLPMAIGFTVIYARLANALSPEALFYACLLPFIAFFGAFAFVLYPARDFLHPVAWCEKVVAAAPRLSAPVAIIRNWTFCLFYVMAELWGSVVVSLLFWGFANQITTVDEAKTFYPLFGLGANVALIFSGRAVKYFSQVRASLPPGVDGWGVSLRGMMTMVVIGGFCVAGTYAFLARQQAKIAAAGLAASGGVAKKKKAKAHMGVGESFTFLAKSPYIRDLATLVVAYGISINLVEVTWKSKIKAQFPNPNDYSAFMGDFSTATGVATFLMMIASRYIFRRFGWGGAAIITPTVLLVTGVAFFALVLSGNTFAPGLAQLGLTPLMAAVLVGAAQNVFSKSAKYSLFDPCKEMAYIPLDPEVQLKGKAAIDVVCNPLGKSGGSAVQQVLILAFGSLAASTPYLGVVLLGCVIAWLKAAKSLDGQFTALQKDQQLAKLAEAKSVGSGGGLGTAPGGGVGSPALKKFKFVSAVNEAGFLEGKFVPLAEGEAVTASMDVVEATSAEDAAGRAAARK